MATTEESVRVRQEGPTITCQVRGRGTMRQCLSLRRFVERSLAAGPAALDVDLHDCTYLDSTFLGTLIVLKRAVDHRGGRFAIVCPSPQARQLLRQMGLDRVLPIIEAERLPDEGLWIEMEGDPSDDGLKHNVVEAHEELAELPGPAGSVFRDVAAELTRQWEAEQRRRAAPREEPAV